MHFSNRLESSDMLSFVHMSLNLHKESSLNLFKLSRIFSSLCIYSRQDALDENTYEYIHIYIYIYKYVCTMHFSNRRIFSHAAMCIHVYKSSQIIFFESSNRLESSQACVYTCFTTSQSLITTPSTSQLQNCAGISETHVCLFPMGSHTKLLKSFRIFSLAFICAYIYIYVCVKNISRRDAV